MNRYRKNVSQLTKKPSIFIQTIVTKLSEIWVGDPISGKILSRICIQGSKKGPDRGFQIRNSGLRRGFLQAIQSSPEQRLTLSQIYDWMVTTVPYFKERSDVNSSAGWKV
jgi:hypothetical protein